MLFREKVRIKLVCSVLLRNEQFVLGPVSLVLRNVHGVDKSDQRVLTGVLSLGCVLIFATEFLYCLRQILFLFLLRVCENVRGRKLPSPQAESPDMYCQSHALGPLSIPFSWANVHSDWLISVTYCCYSVLVIYM